MFTFLVVVIALIAVMMILLVLVQSGKGGGLAGIASGTATTQILGARQAPDILEKITWVLAALFIVLCILTNYAIDSGSDTEGVLPGRVQGGATEQTAPAGRGGAQPTPQQQAPAAPAQNPGAQPR